jgi:7-cyano-7-deazaguanine synthase
MESSKSGQTTSAVLYSGGLDSAVLVALEAREARVHPVYVRAGLAWETEEATAAARLLASSPYAGRVERLVILDCPVTDTYSSTHWAIQGTPPAYDTPDEDVYLVGRNVVLLAKVGVFCATHAIHRIALGPLAGNPFPDATPEFLAAMTRALTLGLAHHIDIAFPLAHLHKGEVVRLGVELGVPFARTMSCMNPIGGRHCGQCSKCRERLDAFRQVGLDDPAEYAV